MDGVNRRSFLQGIAAGLAQSAASARPGELDLTKAVVVHPKAFAGPELKAVTILVEEVEKRTGIRWKTAETAGDSPAISLGRRSGPSEGYRIAVRDGNVEVLGNDARGVLYGVGRLLREVRMSKGSITLPAGFSITTAPKYRLRGHEMAYRPKTNSYDAWTLPVWEQYFRDLVVFGTNAVELAPPRSDDDPDSPHFHLPPMEMMIGMSRLLDEYGLDVWIWYPAMDADYSDPKTVEFALKEWGEVFRQLPRIDAVFVPGGDPGHTRPKYLMPMLEKQAENLRRYHPKAHMWTSPQGFTQEWLDEFYAILRTEPTWLTGIVWGQQVRVSLAKLREAVPMRYPIRHLTDLTHSKECHMPVPDWDTAYAVTEGREGINPRPTDQLTVFNALQPYTIGFLSYSEGCHDDVNKMVWNALAWDPDTPVLEILRQYSRYFLGVPYTDTFAQGLLALERNWRGPLATNEAVYTTLEQFQSMERSAAPRELLNWRFQQALYRAYYDAYTLSRLLYETELEARAMEELRQAGAAGSLRVMAQAEEILDQASMHVSQDWRARVFALAEALFQSIGMQLSVPRYYAIRVDRGANLDSIDVPLNNRLWLKDRFDEIRKSTSEDEKLRGIQTILEWTNPGPCGFYDDLGNLEMQPHLVRGVGYKKDPASMESARVGFGPPGRGRVSWWNYAETLYDTPLEMHYTGLDPTAQYSVKVLYSGGEMERKIRLSAGEREIHPYITKPVPIRPLEFDIPAAATASGEVTLRWQGVVGIGHNGRGCQVSEVWLMKKV
jgi:hypothetical protein